MTRFCFCLIALLVCSSTAEAQFRRFAKPCLQRATPLKNTTEMVSSARAADDLKKMFTKDLFRQLMPIIEQETLKVSTTLDGLDHPKVNIMIDPDFSHWTMIQFESPENKLNGAIFLIPTAKLSQSEVAKLAPGTTHFVGAIGFTEEILPETKRLIGQEDRLYSFSDRTDGSASFVTDFSVMLLAIDKNPNGQLRLLGYGPDPQPIFNAEVSIVDSTGESKTEATTDWPVIIESNEDLHYHVLRSLTKEGQESKTIDHFLRVDVVERGPVKLQIDLFGKYRARF